MNSLPFYVIVGCVLSGIAIVLHSRWNERRKRPNDEIRQRAREAFEEMQRLAETAQAASQPPDPSSIPSMILRQAVFAVRLAHHLMPDRPVTELQPVANALSSMSEPELIVVMTALGVPTDNVPTSLEEVRDEAGRGLLVPLESDSPPEGPSRWERLTRHE